MQLPFFKRKLRDFSAPQAPRLEQASLLKDISSCNTKNLNMASIQLIPDNEMRKITRTSLNRIPDMSDWRPGGPLVKYMQGMDEGPYIHRKAWEYGLCVQGLFELGAIHPGAKGLGVAAGYERPLFYLTKYVDKIVATDLYDNPDHEGKPEMLTNPEKFAWCPWDPERLEVLQMNACKLDFPDASFDFCFSLSSIEHFGPRSNTVAAMREMNRVLKPGGIACIVTELILNKTKHAEYFTESEFQDIIIKAEGFELVGGDPDLRISKSLFDYPLVIGEDDLAVSPHIVLKERDVIFTSCSAFLKKTK